MIFDPFELGAIKIKPALTFRTNVINILLFLSISCSLVWPGLWNSSRYKRSNSSSTSSYQTKQSRNATPLRRSANIYPPANSIYNILHIIHSSSFSFLFSRCCVISCLMVWRSENFPSSEWNSKSGLKEMSICRFLVISRKSSGQIWSQYWI